MDKQKTTLLGYIKPVFICSFSTGEICLMDDIELLECFQTNKIPKDTFTGRQICHFTGEEKQFDYDFVHVSLCPEDSLVKLDKLRNSINQIQIKMSDTLG